MLRSGVLARIHGLQKADGTILKPSGPERTGSMNTSICAVGRAKTLLLVEVPVGRAQLRLVQMKVCI